MMNNNDSIEVLMALKNWILRVAGEKGCSDPGRGEGLAGSRRTGAKL